MFIEIVGVIGTSVGIFGIIVGIIVFCCFASETNKKNRQVDALAKYLNVKFSDGEKVVKVIELPDEEEEKE